MDEDVDAAVERLGGRGREGADSVGRGGGLGRRATRRPARADFSRPVTTTRAPAAARARAMAAPMPLVEPVTMACSAVVMA